MAAGNRIGGGTSRIWALALGLMGLAVCGCPGPGKLSTKSSGSEPLEAMKVAYQRASSYADAAELHIEYTRYGETGEVQPLPFAASLERPNKVRINAFQGVVACDGKQFYAVVADDSMADQILYRPAPADLAIDEIYSDPVLVQMLSGGTGVRLPQLDLLLADKPLVAIFGEGYETKRLEDRAISSDEPACQRVEIKSDRGRFVAWIEPKKHILRRLEMPTALFQQDLKSSEQVTFRIWAEFQGARLGGKIDDKAFQFGELPATAMLLKQFVPPPPSLRDEPSEMLGKQIDKFEFVDLDGKPFDSESIKGKVAVVDFWFRDCPFCFKSFPNLQTVYDQFKNDDRVVFVTVDTDESEVTNDMLRAAFAQAKLNLPIVRDPKHFAREAFKLEACPTLVLLGPDGTVQQYELGFKPDLAETLPKRLEAVLAGTDLAQQEVARYEQEVEQFKRRKLEQLEGTTQQIELPQAKIAEKSEPAALKLTKLWTAAGLKNPGNLLVLPTESGPRILVLDGWSKVVELDAAGKIAAQHEITLPAGATITQLRTAVDAAGARYFVGFTAREQQLFLFDESWKQLLRFPDSTHAGIFDVQLGDLDGDGQLELVVGYAGSVGVQGVSLAGKRLWSNRTLDNVISAALLDPDAEGHRRIWCCNEQPAIAVLDYQGKSLPSIPVPNRPVDVLVLAHLGDSSSLDIAALASPKPAEMVALGLDSKGTEMWSYPLPIGQRNTPCNVLVAGRVLPQGPGQWLLTGADGSIHILAADGKPLDHFAYGSELTGIATAEIDGRPVLLVSSPHELTAWAVDAPQGQPEISAARD